MGNNINDRIIYDCVFQGISVILEEGIDQVLIKIFKILFHKLDMFKTLLKFHWLPKSIRGLTQDWPWVQSE